MSDWPTAPLRDLCEVNIGRTPSRNEPTFWAGSYPWASIRDLASGDVSETREQISGEAIKRMPPPAPAGTLLASFKLTIGRVGVARQAMHHNEAIASLPIIRPDRVDRDYLRYLLPRVMLATTANNAVLGKVLNKATLQELPIPLPPLDEQRRIVGLLDRAAEIRRSTDAARSRARAIIPALFLDTFGDPATNPKGWPTAKIGEVVKVTGGGTPSKANPDFWNGTIPWVSPKDMKPPTIFDSEDKITANAMAASPAKLIPAGNVLIVVRGMILAHTVPIRMNAIAVTLNQDMKALVPTERLVPTFLRWALGSLHGYLLSKVRESAHGTKKLETDILTSYQIVVPPLNLQTAFAEQAQRLEALARALDTACAKAEAMAAALSAEMFGQGQAYRRHQPRLRGASGGASATMVG